MQQKYCNIYYCNAILRKPYNTHLVVFKYKKSAHPIGQAPHLALVGQF